MEPSTWFGPTTKLRRSLLNRLKPGWRIAALVWALFGGSLFIEHNDRVGFVLAAMTMIAALGSAIKATVSA